MRVLHKENQENRDPHLVPTDPHANSKLCPSDLFFPLNIRFPHKSAVSKLSHMRLKEFAKLTPSFVRCAFGTRKTKKTVLFIYPEAASKLTQEIVSPIRAPLQSNPKSEHDKLQSVKNRCVYCFELWSKPLSKGFRSRSYTRPRPVRPTQ